MKKRIVGLVCLLLVGAGILFFIEDVPGEELAEPGMEKMAKNSDPASKTTTSSLDIKQLQATATNLMSDIVRKFKLDKVKVVREKCDEDNAFYDPETKSITICLEMVDSVWAYAQEQDTDPKIQKDIATNSLMFFFLHELGHAYIDVMQFPVTGREEDVADQIASYFILELEKDNSFDWIADGAFTFYQYSEENPEIDEEALADVHSLDKQRFYNIACWLYGATADESIVTDRGLPEERAQ